MPAAMTAQEKANSDKAKEYKFLSFNGVGIQADLLGYLFPLISNYTQAEGAVEVNIGNRLYPIAEVGYGWCDHTDKGNGIRNKTAAPYYKVGFNYNFFTSKSNPDPKNYVYGLARFGWCNFKYDLDTPDITDPVWGDNTSLHLTGVDGAGMWLEVGAGIKAKIAKGFHMGWSIRYKFRLSQKNGPNSKEWYIPGFGINTSNCFGGTYNIIYEF